MQQELEQGIVEATSTDKAKSLPVSEPNVNIGILQYPYTEALPTSIEQELLDSAQQRKKISPRTLRLALNVGDGILLAVAYAIAVVVALQLHIKFNLLSSYNGWDAIFIWGCLTLASWKFAANLTQSHDIVNASNRFRSSICVLFALALTVVFWTVLTYPFIVGNRALYAQVLLYVVGVLLPLLLIWRVLFATISTSSRFHRNAIIVGLNDTGIATATEISNAKRAGVNVLGYISDAAEESLQEPLQHTDFPLLGGKDALHRLAKSGLVDMIIMALDYRANSALFNEAIDAAQNGVAVVPVTAVYELTSGKVPVEHIGEQWYISLPSETIISPFYLAWQKVLDVAFGLFGSAILLLVLPFLATIIRLDSAGPIFYSQERLGYQGKKFRIYKFRSMYVDAEGRGQAQWAKARDPRVTRVGHFMRATHLDELPQVFNILRGEMSLVGPRPERQEFVDRLEKIVPFYRCRLVVKPGLTGWAQVKYRYANSDQDALIKAQYDLYYIKHRSFMLDVFIMLNTVIEVLFRQGV